MLIALFTGCFNIGVSKPLDTKLFNYSQDMKDYLKKITIKSKYLSLEKETAIVNTKDFSVTNKYVIPFLYYNLSVYNIDPSTIKVDEIEKFFENTAYYRAQNEILYKEAVAKGVKITDDEVSAQIENISNGNVEQFKSLISKSPLTMEYITLDLRQVLTIEKYKKDVLQKDINISDKDMNEYFLNNPTASLINPRVKGRHILVKIDAKKGKDAARSKIEKALADLKNGKTFEDTAKKYSEDDLTSTAGGEFGDFIERGSMDPDLEDKMFGTPEGKISDIFETSYGFHIVKIDKIESEKKATFDEVKDSISTLLIVKKKNQLVNDEIERVKKKYNLKYVI